MPRPPRQSQQQTSSDSADASTTTQDIHHAVVRLDALSPHPRNYRRHPESQVARLSASLARFGQVRSIVVQEGADGRYLIVAGHGLIDAARSHGLRELRADVIPATWTSAQVEGYLIADNETTRGADDDLVALAAMLEEQQHSGFDLDALGYSQEELAALLEQLAQEALAGDRRDVDDPDGGGDDFDTTPDESGGPTRVQPGDLWQLGQHRLLCGDSTRAEDVARLMAGEAAQMVWSDPPYGISIVATNGYVGSGEAYGIPFGGVKKVHGDVGGAASHIRKTGKPYIAEQRLGSVGAAKPFGSAAVRGSIGAANMIDVGKYAPVIGDDTTETAVNSYTLLAEMYPSATHIWWGGNYYANMLPPSSCWLVWDKENTGYFADCELAWCSDKSAVRIFRHMWNGLMKASEKGQRRVHPTQKPIALAAWVFDKYGAQDDIVLDPFCGSGMSVIAGERIKRAVYALEMSADYCDVILRRWEAETGREATLLARAARREASDDGHEE